MCDEVEMKCSATRVSQALKIFFSMEPKTFTKSRKAETLETIT